MPENDQPILDFFQSFLVDNELPLGLMDFLRESLSQGWTPTEILLRLRETPEYKNAYPENDLRQTNKLSFMPEAEIRAYRDEAKRLAKAIHGTSITNHQISQLIGAGTSVAEFEHRLMVFKSVKDFGGGVKQVLEDRLGASITDQDLQEFFDPEINSAELDRAYEDALYRGRPERLGLGIRPQEEATLLRQFGIDPNQAYQKYEQIAGELPRFAKLKAIENAANGLIEGGSLPSSGNELFNDTPYNLLFRGIMQQDQNALLELQQTMARESARFTGGGGPAFQGTRALGLQTSDERN